MGVREGAFQQRTHSNQGNARFLPPKTRAYARPRVHVSKLAASESRVGVPLGVPRIRDMGVGWAARSDQAQIQGEKQAKGWHFPANLGEPSSDSGARENSLFCSDFTPGRSPVGVPSNPEHGLGSPGHHQSGQRPTRRARSSKAPSRSLDDHPWMSFPSWRCWAATVVFTRSPRR